MKARRGGSRLLHGRVHCWLVLLRSKKQEVYYTLQKRVLRRQNNTHTQQDGDLTALKKIRSLLKTESSGVSQTCHCIQSPGEVAWGSGGVLTRILDPDKPPEVAITNLAKTLI